MKEDVPNRADTPIPTPTPQQIQMYLNNVRKEKALKKQKHYQNLVSNALP